MALTTVIGAECIAGTADAFITSEQSTQLSDFFVDADTHVHGQGHVVPQRATGA